MTYETLRLVCTIHMFNNDCEKIREKLNAAVWDHTALLIIRYMLTRPALTPAGKLVLVGSSISFVMLLSSTDGWQICKQTSRHLQCCAGAYGKRETSNILNATLCSFCCLSANSLIPIIKIVKTHRQRVAIESINWRSVLHSGCSRSALIRFEKVEKESELQGSASHTLSQTTQICISLNPITSLKKL